MGPLGKGRSYAWRKVPTAREKTLNGEKPRVGLAGKGGPRGRDRFSLVRKRKKKTRPPNYGGGPHRLGLCESVLTPLVAFSRGFLGRGHKEDLAAETSGGEIQPACGGGSDRS